MVTTDTVYAVGDLPSVLLGKITWPAAGSGNFQFNGGGDGNATYMQNSYGGSVYVPDLGSYGTMIFGRTGEATFDAQLTEFAVSEEAATWNMFQQPLYAVTSAEAASINADCYYSVADYTALPAGNKIGLDYAAWYAAWDKSFPVGFGSAWVMRQKIQNVSFLGNEMPHWFRYNMPRYIPAAMTGTGTGAIIVNSRGTIYGPFAQGAKPDGVTDAEWYADVWGTGRRKHYLSAMNVSTKQWTKLTTAIPDFTGYEGDVSSPHACVDLANKRVYYSTYNGSTNALYYADFTSGLAGMTMNGPTNLTEINGAGMDQGGNSVLCVPTSGPNAGRRLWYMKNYDGELLLIDIDNGTIRSLAVSGLPADAAWWYMTYRASTNELIISTVSLADGVRSFKVVIPTDPTDEGSYGTMSMTTLAFAPGVAIDVGEATNRWSYGEITRYLDSLGVILLPQAHTATMLAYRPS
jgi:hypothetical protein